MSCFKKARLLVQTTDHAGVDKNVDVRCDRFLAIAVTDEEDGPHYTYLRGACVEHADILLRAMVGIAQRESFKAALQDMGLEVIDLSQLLQKPPTKETDPDA